MPSSEDLHGQLVVTPPGKASGGTLPVLPTRGIFLHATRQCLWILSAPSTASAGDQMAGTHIGDQRFQVMGSKPDPPHMLAGERPRLKQSS